MNLSHGNCQAIINKIAKKLLEEFKIKLALGAEIEFYLVNLEDDPAPIFADLQTPILGFDKERGWHQFECMLDKSFAVAEYPQVIHDLRNDIIVTARKYEAKADFSAKPFEDDYGSSIHIHVSIHNKEDHNLLSWGRYEENEYLQNAVGGLLDLAQEFVYLLCSEDLDFKRLEAPMLSPTNVSWGGNNRTTLVRIPDTDSSKRRFELRIAPSSASPFVLIALIMIGVYHGFKNNLKLPERIWGDASDEQYELAKLSKSMEEAKTVFEDKGQVLKYIKEFGG